jgi:transposase
VCSQALRAGDILVADNCRIHLAVDIIRPLRDALAAVGVRFVLLPTYSPEYQPAELVFARVKAALRASAGRSGLAFGADIVRAFATVSRADVVGFYQKCIRDV